MTASGTTTKYVPNWKVSGDWFDVCKCNMPCPCEFAQAPTHGERDGILAYHMSETTLDGLNVLGLASFKGNIWAGEGTTKIDLGFFDEAANEKQREALIMIFTGQAGGFMDDRKCKRNRSSF
jgi:hypothetical protein